MNRIKSHEREGKILVDLEDAFGLECVIKEPTRITTHSSTLLDVLLTNRPQSFKRTGVYDPALSDHGLVYGILTIKACQNRSRITVEAIRMLISTT